MEVIGSSLEAEETQVFACFWAMMRKVLHIKKFVVQRDEGVNLLGGEERDTRVCVNPCLYCVRRYRLKLARFGTADNLHKIVGKMHRKIAIFLKQKSQHPGVLRRPPAYVFRHLIYE